MLFGTKKPEGKTLLLVDVENGSVGSALVHVRPDQPLRMFGEKRVYLHILPTRDSQLLLDEIRQGIRATAEHIAEVTARLRQHASAAHIGSISGTAVYLGAPWGRPNLASGQPALVGSMQDMIRQELLGLGSTPYKFYTATGGVLGGTRRAHPYDEDYLLCIVGAEVTELLLVHERTAVGYATLPLGTHTLMRTLRAHGFSDAETHSAIRLPASRATEPMRAAQEHFAGEFEIVVGQLLKNLPIKKVWIVSRGELGEWFAKALSQSPDVASLFPQGGEVRVMRAAHVTPYLSAHAHEPDLLLSLHALHAEVL